MKEYNKITVIVSSKKQQADNQVFLENLKNTCDCSVQVFYVVNPDGVPLTKVYKDYLKHAETDIVVFMHDDIEILKKGWGTELIKAFQENEEYGVIGIAGSGQFDANGAWWSYKDIYGQVLHRHDGKSWLSTYSPLFQGLKEVCVVDGLFFAIEKTRIKYDFDESLLGFHFYEIDLCLANYTTKSCKIGVTTSIRIAHNSLGEVSETWYQNREKIIQKYQNYFPIAVERK